MPLRVFGSGGSGDTNDAMEAIYYAIYNGADIINLSFVGFGYDSGFEDAIKTAYEAGIVVVAAAGNDDLDLDEEANVTYPVCYQGSEAADWVLGVSASNEDDDKAEFSNYGNDCVDISAPGTGIWGPLYQDDNHGSFHSYYGGYWSGTSVATPMVSGAAALLKAYRPELTVNQIQLALRLGAEALNDNYTDYYHSKIGSGRLNIANALSLAAGFEEVASLVPTGNIYVSIADQPSKVRAFTPGGQQVLELTPFGNDYTGDINISAGDIDGDGQEEIVVAAGDGAPPEVKIFETDGSEVNSFYAYSLEKTTGVWVSTGDVNGDGSDEIITINGEGKATKVKVFEYSGRVLEDFLPFGVGTTNGGRITSGDVDGDGAAEIIVGAGPGLEPRIRVFEYNGELVEQFNAYEESYDKGVLVATADLDGNGIDEIVTGTELGGGPHVRTFSMEGKVLGQFFAYDDLFRGGVRLTSLDTNGDGIDEIVTGAGPHGGPHVRIFDGESNVMGGFFAFIESNHVGINLSGF